MEKIKSDEFRMKKKFGLLKWKFFLTEVDTTHPRGKKS
jgi:hypothetical protein